MYYIIFIFGVFLVQYVVHVYGYLKEWRKNPHWSFSCCLALILPVIDMPGDISGLAGTNVLNTQLDTGHMEMTTIVGAVKDSGAIDVTLEEDKQKEGQKDNYNGDQQDNRRKNNQGTQTELSTYF